MLKLNHLTGFGSGAAAGAGGASYAFDGSSYLSVADHADWDILNQTDATIDMWIYPNNVGGTEILCAQDEGGVDFGYYLYISGGQLRCSAYATSSTLEFSGGYPSNGEWSHVALVKKSNEFGIYLNGTQTAYVSDASYADTYAVDLEIGGSTLNGSYFDGFIDDVRVMHSNVFNASPNATPNDTITVPTAEHISDANTKLLIHGGEAYTGPLTDETTQSCVTFDGTGDYLSVPDHADWDFGTGDWAIDFWVYMDTPQEECFIAQYDSGTNQRAWTIEANSSTNLQLWRSDTGGEGGSVANHTYAPVAKTWHHIAVARDTNNLRAFFDGAQIGSTTDITGYDYFDSSAAMTIGSRLSSGSAVVLFTGKMAEIRISDTNRGWTGATITVPTERHTSDGNTLLLIHGDEVLTTNWASGITGSAATFTDSGNTGHTVTEAGNAISAIGGTFTDSGNTGHTVGENGNAQKETEQEFKFADDGVGYFLDGTGDYLSIPDHADWNFGDGDLTIELWIYLFDVRPVASGVAFFDQHDDGGNRLTFGLNNNNTLAFYAQYSSSWIVNTSQTHGLRNNTWHHIAVVKDGNDWEFFQDGVSLGSATDAGTLPDLAANPTIGFWEAAGTYVKGYIDEYRISDVARYTTGFTPSTTQFTSDANTLLLIHGGEAKTGTTGSGATFTDSGNTGHTVTENGNAIESTGNFYKF
jgi:hypothetical protein